MRSRGAGLHVPPRGERVALPLSRRLVALLLAVGCAPAPPPPSGPPARVVSLAPSITEIVYGLGAGDRLVGVCGQCDHPAAVARLPRVGGYLSPSVEATLGVRPDLVLAVPSPGNREAVRAIERAGVRVLILHDRTLADLWASIRDVSGVLEVPDAGERLATDLRAGLEAVRARVTGLPPQKVLVIVGHDPLVAVGRDTLQDELVSIAGGVNVAAEAGSVWPRITLELVVARAPDVIVDVAMGTESAGRALFARLTTVPAVQHGRVVTLPTDALFRAGPRVPEAARALAAAIHPEAYRPEAFEPGAFRPEGSAG